MTDKDPATVLEDAADLLLIRGRHKGDYGVDGGPRCVLGAIAEASGLRVFGTDAFDGPDNVSIHHQPAVRALEARVVEHRLGSGAADWNDATKDDFEVIDTLRLVAKDLRNEAGV